MSLESLVKRLADQAIGERVVFLMPEWSFEYASYTIECTSRAVFTVKDLKTIIRDKKEHMRRSHSIAMDGMSHSVVNCRVDGVPVQSLLGKT